MTLPQKRQLRSVDPDHMKTKLMEELLLAAISVVEKLLDLLQQMLELNRTPDHD